MTLPGVLEDDGQCANFITCAVSNKCNKNQTLYFYIDTTDSNKFENFCPLVIVMQMLVAAFDPSATSGTKIGALLFSDNAKDKAPSTVFDMGTSCFTAVQGPEKSLLSLINEFGICLDKGRDYDSTMFPSLCGEGTSAVRGLEKIYELASSTRNSTAESAVLMVTDGTIMDNAAERTKVLDNLKSAGIKTLIAAGIGDADVENLKLYTSDDNILVATVDQNNPGQAPVDLGIAIVDQMANKSILCQDHGN